MTISPFYHAFGLKGVKHMCTEYSEAITVFNTKETFLLEQCLNCRNRNTIRRTGNKKGFFE